MLLITGLVFGGALFSQAQKEGQPRKPVDIKAEKSTFDGELNKRHGIEQNAMILVGDVVFHHNGAVITCDSAIRYSDRRIDCFKNVIINKDSTFVYGDRAEYNGDINLARVYSPVVKVVDGDATLYTYNFSFDTRTNIGTWFGGGVLYQQDNVMESEKGYYYSDLHELVAVKGVEMKNDSHQIISDSVRYNTETKIANFYTRTYIWTREGEIISAIKGRYNTQDSTYFFHDNAYVLTEFRETWADTIDFNARVEDLVMYGNIQIDDNENMSSAFGDYGQYWGERGETMLTRRPSLLNYNEDRGNSDTLYMRADTVFMFVVYPSDSRRRDTITPGVPDPHAHLRWLDSLPDSVKTAKADSLRPVIVLLRSESDSLRLRADSIMNALYPPPPPPLVEPAADSLPEGQTTPADSLGQETGQQGLTTSERRGARRKNRSRGPSADYWHYADTLLVPGAELPDVMPPLIMETQLSVGERPDSEVLPPTTGTESVVPTPESGRPEAGANLPAPTGGRPAGEGSSAVQEPEKIEPPEVKELRARVSELSARADSLDTVVNYLRPQGDGGGPPVDSLALRRTDSLAHIDSLARADSILRSDPKALKKHEKALEKAEKQRLRDEKRAAKAALRAEKRAAKAAAKAEKLALRRRRIAERRGLPPDRPASDSLHAADSLALLDSVARLDSLARGDSLAGADSFGTAPPADTTATGADTTMRIFRGWHNVKIWRKDMQAVCDSMVGFSVDSTLHLYTDPVLWYSDSQVVADSITAFSAGGEIERAEFFGDPIMSSRLAPKQFNQVTGRTMTAWFHESAVYRHDADGNARALYYMQEEGDPKPVAFLVMTAANMSFLIENDSLRYIVPREVVDWTVYPMDQIPPTQPTELKGFKWLPERRPELEDVFTRRIRPSERGAYEALSRPLFPIAARIDRRREYLIENRMWGDRNDPLPAHAVEYVRSLQQP